MGTAVVSDNVFLEHLTGRHPECPERLGVILEALARRRTLDGVTVLAAQEADRADLESVHTVEMIDRALRACAAGEPALDADTVISNESYRVALAATGGALRGLQAVLTGSASNAFILSRPPGHHATLSQSMGFCLFNHAAVVARQAMLRYGVERVLILDWDVHHGNGTQDIFYRDPSVFYLSWHQAGLYPGTGSTRETGAGAGLGSTRNVPFPAGTPPGVYREAFQESLSQVVRAFSPDLMVLSAGFDGHAEDPLGGLLLEDSDFREMSLRVVELADRYCGGRLVSILEGGYNLRLLGDTVATHVEVLKDAGT